MKLTLLIGVVVCAQGIGQTFEVASIKAAGPANPFHASGSMTGGPGTSDPGMFRCTCSVAALITKAFELQKYQFPGEASLPGENYSVSAKIPAGATHAQFSAMLQNLLKERFGLAWRFDQKDLQGYQLLVAKGGPKLKVSSDAAVAPVPENHSGYQHRGGGHEGGGMSFGGMGRYRADHLTMEELARVLSNQITRPVEDQTGLKGKYDVALSWSADVPQHDHAEGRGGEGHRSAPADDVSGMTVFEAVQSQLGLKLVAAKKASTRMFVVEHLEKTPSIN